MSIPDFAEPVKVRDAALMQVYPGLMRWYARKLVRLHPDVPADVEEMVATAVVIFLEQWKPEHAALCVKLCKFSVLNANRHVLARHRAEQRARKALAERRPVPSSAPDEAAIGSVRAAVAVLNPAMRPLLADRFGLDGQPPKTMRQLAALRGEAHQGVSTKVRVGLDRVRSVLAARQVGAW